MKTFVTILLVSVGGFNLRAVESDPPMPATPAVVISTDYLNRLVAEAWTNNPALKAANARARSATLNAEAVRTWEDPMAWLGGSVYSPRGVKSSEDGDLTYGLEQKLPLWGRPQQARRAAQAQASLTAAEVNYRAQRLRADLLKALVTTALAGRVVEIGEQDLAWIEAIAQSTENKYRAGQSAIADTLQIQNEVALRRDALRTDHRRLGHEQVALNRWLNRDLGSTWPALKLPPVAAAIPLSDKMLSLALQNEPRLKVLEEEIKQASATAELTRRSRLPDVSLGVEGRQYSGDGGFRSGMFTLRFSLPWANGGRYRKDYERDQEQQRSVELEREDQRWMVREELHHLSVGIEAARREALLQDGEITTRAAQALSSRLSEWASGRGMLRDVLEARRKLLDSELMSARATAEEHQMYADMLLWTGLENLETLTKLANEPALLHDHEDHDPNP